MKKDADRNDDFDIFKRELSRKYSKVIVIIKYNNQNVLFNSRLLSNRDE